MTYQRISSCLFSGLLYNPEYQAKRHFLGIFYGIINKMDRDRVKEVGKERACAEWLLRCGASVRWKDSKNFFTDYNLLPPARRFKNLYIEEVDADDAAIMPIGFEHFSGLKHITKMRFHHCAYFDDNCVRQLDYVKDTLQHLEISDCDVSDTGVELMCNLKELKTLKLIKLEEIRNPKESVRDLKECLPNCDISYQHQVPET